MSPSGLRDGIDQRSHWSLPACRNRPPIRRGPLLGPHCIGVSVAHFAPSAFVQASSNPPRCLRLLQATLEQVRLDCLTGAASRDAEGPHLEGADLGLK